MEADWEVEIGGRAPWIDAAWPGFVDLRIDPARAESLPEVEDFPDLALALTTLNAPDSPVWTSKCDFWAALEPGTFDGDEMDAPDDRAQVAMGMYVDLLPRVVREWEPLAMAEAACRGICAELGKVPLRCCRVDVVIRRAALLADVDAMGITAYLTACGAATEEARKTLGLALAAFVNAVSTARRYNGEARASSSIG